MISEEQRSTMVEDLKSKAEVWQLNEAVQRFNNNLPTNPTIPTFGIETTNNGYYYYSDELISFCDLTNGKIFRIRKVWQDKDWDCYVALENKGKTFGSFRVDAPLNKQIININGTNWEYCDLQSPGQDYGRNFNDDVFSWPALSNGIEVNASITEQNKANVQQYFMQYIAQAKLILQEASSIASSNNCGLPDNLIDIMSRYTDSQGVFWSDFDQYSWNNNDRSMFIEKELFKFREVLNFSKLCGVLDSSQIQSIHNQARSEWTAI